MGLLRRASPAADDVELTAVSGECEAFLAGTLAEVRARSGEAPVWTWLNPIAHRDRATVVAMATSDADDVRATTMRTIAGAVLAAGGDLGALQRDVLVPLELAHVGEVMTPRRLVELVGRALYIG